jgi:hypothetical protein
METVTLKYRFGSFQVTWRPKRMVDGLPRYEKHVFDWNLDNDSRCAVPREWWNRIQDEYINTRDNLKYKESFFEL